MEHKWSTDSLDEKYVVIPSFPKVRDGARLAPPWVSLFHLFFTGNGLRKNGQISRAYLCSSTIHDGHPFPALSLRNGGYRALETRSDCISRAI